MVQIWYISSESRQYSNITIDMLTVYFQVIAFFQMVPSTETLHDVDINFSWNYERINYKLLL